jgi:hypothetical protein
VRISRIFTGFGLSAPGRRVIKLNTFDERTSRTSAFPHDHVRPALLLFLLVSQAAGGSRGVLAHESHPKFPKNRQQVWRFFFASCIDRKTFRIRL